MDYFKKNLLYRNHIAVNLPGGKKQNFFQNESLIFVTATQKRYLIFKLYFMNEIITELNKTYQLSEAADIWLRRNTHRHEYKKHSILLKPGETCNYLWYIEKGALRAFETSEIGKVFCNWIMLENDIATSVVSFFVGVSTRETVEALEDTVVWRISKTDLFEGLKEHLSLTMLTLLLTLKYYCLTREIESSLRKKTPENLYRYLVLHHPELVDRVTHKLLASFMGISVPTYYKVVA